MFPTTYSTLDPAALAIHISKHYALGNCSGHLIQRGVGDTYAVIAPARRFILRVYRNTHRTLEHIQAEVELLMALRAAGVAVSYPIPDQTGQCVQTFIVAEGQRHAVLFSFAPGENIPKLSDLQLNQLGAEIAKFHQVSSKIQLGRKRWDLNLQTTLIDPIESVRHCFATIPGELTWWLHATSHAKQHLESLSTEEFASGYCHYDFLPKNFHFDDNGITLFDFDFFGRGWLVNDLMTFWTQLALDVQFNRITQQEADRSFGLVLDAYQVHCPLSNNELRAIPSLSLAWWCYYMGFHATHDQFTALVQPAHLKMRTALIRQLTEKKHHVFQH